MAGLAPLPDVANVTVTGKAEAPLKVMVLFISVPSATLCGLLIVIVGVNGWLTVQFAGTVHVGPPVGTTLLETLVVAAAVTVAV